MKGKWRERERERERVEQTLIFQVTLSWRRRKLNGWVVRCAYFNFAW